MENPRVRVLDNKLALVDLNPPSKGNLTCGFFILYLRCGPF